MCLMLVLLLTIWGFHALFWIFYSPLCTWAAEQKRLSPVKSHIWAAMFVEVSWFDLLLLPLSFLFLLLFFFFVVVVSTLKSMLGVMPVYSQWGLFNLSQRYTVYDISLLAVWKKEKNDCCNLISSWCVHGFNCSLNTFVCFLQCYPPFLFPEPRGNDGISAPEFMQILHFEKRWKVDIEHSEI